MVVTAAPADAVADAAAPLVASSAAPWVSGVAPAHALTPPAGANLSTAGGRLPGASTPTDVWNEPLGGTQPVPAAVAAADAAGPGVVAATVTMHAVPGTAVAASAAGVQASPVTITAAPGAAAAGAVPPLTRATVPAPPGAATAGPVAPAVTASPVTVTAGPGGAVASAAAPLVHSPRDLVYDVTAPAARWVASVLPDRRAVSALPNREEVAA